MALYTEQDFTDLAEAANLALADGQPELAQRLDRLARIANLFLSTQFANLATGGLRPPGPKKTWRDIPSTLI